MEKCKVSFKQQLPRRDSFKVATTKVVSLTHAPGLKRLARQTSGKCSDGFSIPAQAEVFVTCTVHLACTAEYTTDKNDYQLSI